MADETKKLKHTAAELDNAVDMLLEVYTREEIDDLFSQKITAVPGSGLITDDEREKLTTFENYDDTEAKSEIALNRSTLGYQRKNLLMNNCATLTKNGVTATVNDDRSVTLSGQNTAKAFVIFGNFGTGKSVQDQMEGNKKFIPNGRYIISGGVTGCGIQVCASTDGSNEIVRKTAYLNDEAFTITDSDKYVWFRLLIQNGANFSTPVTVYPMVRSEGIGDNTYEPYKPSVEERLAALEEKFAVSESGAE